MTEYKNIFLDTAPIIYLLDETVNYSEKLVNIFTYILDNEIPMLTSTITCAEYLTYPYRTKNTDKVTAFFDFLRDCNIKAYPIDIEIAKKAAEIRANYKDFKSMDCLQLATACITDCDLFLTNDKQLLQFKDLKCVIVDELFAEFNRNY